MHPAPDWNPTRYAQFAEERAQPFHDLLALVEPGHITEAVDLGCGSGELTNLAADRLGIERIVGIDNSPAMLAETDQHAGRHVSFRSGDIATWTGSSDCDLVLASASLQWVPDHPAVLRAWSASLRPGGQLAVQVPANAYMPSHLVADATAHAEPFRSMFGDGGPPSDPVADNVLEPEQYATLLYDLGFVEQHIRLQIYPHVLADSRSVVDWVRGTTLTRFQRRLDPQQFEAFVVEYERRLLAVIGQHAPYFFPFRRILMWGRVAG